jgi:hypothetical protein
MLSELTVHSPSDALDKSEDIGLSLDNVKGVSNFPTLEEEAMRTGDACNHPDAVKVIGETVPLPLQSNAARIEVKSAVASRELQMPVDLVVGFVVDMSENILHDTLSDLNPMSPRGESSKVTPFAATPFPGFTMSEVPENREKFKLFLECPQVKYDKKGMITKSSKVARSLWRANQYVYDSLFEIPVDNDTQAQKEEEMRETVLEEGKGA